MAKVKTKKENLEQERLREQELEWERRPESPAQARKRDMDGFVTWQKRQTKTTAEVFYPEHPSPKEPKIEPAPKSATPQEAPRKIVYTYGKIEFPEFGSEYLKIKYAHNAKDRLNSRC